MDIITNSPGSFHEFANQNPDLNYRECVVLYGRALARYRQDQADQQGLGLDEMHGMLRDNRVALPPDVAEAAKVAHHSV